MVLVKILLTFVILSMFSLGASGIGRGVGGCTRSVSQEFIATAHAQGFHSPKATAEPAAKPGALVEVRPSVDPKPKPMPLWKQIGRAGLVTFAVQSIVGVLKVGTAIILPIALIL